jgi:hypothetical protein
MSPMEGSGRPSQYAEINQLIASRYKVALFAKYRTGYDVRDLENIIFAFEKGAFGLTIHSSSREKSVKFE